MNQQEQLISRKQRHRLGKRKNRAYSVLVEDGLIIILPFLLLPVSEGIATVLLVIFTLTLPFVTKQKIIMLFSNAVLLTLLLIFIYSVNFVNMHSDLNIILLLSLILTGLLIFLIQVYAIVIKVYSVETVKHPNVDKAPWYVRFTVKIIHLSNLVIDKVSLLLPLFYYAFITVLIIYVYAVLYNGLFITYFIVMI